MNDENLKSPAVIPIFTVVRPYSRVSANSPASGQESFND